MNWIRLQLNKIEYKKLQFFILKKLILYVVVGIVFISIIILCLLVFWPRSFDTILISKETYIDSSGVIIDTSKSLQRIKAMLFIGRYGKDSVKFLKRSNDYAVIDIFLTTDDTNKIDKFVSSNKIKLTDDKKMTFIIELIDKDGNQYTPNTPNVSMGADGKRLIFGFKPEISKKVKIIKVILKSDIGLTCKKIVWRDFNSQ